MEVTERMLQVAVKKAVELKVIPAWAGTEGYLENWKNIKEILVAAINAASQQANPADKNITGICKCGEELYIEEAGGKKFIACR